MDHTLAECFKDDNVSQWKTWKFDCDSDSTGTFWQCAAQVIFAVLDLQDCGCRP